MSRSRINQSLLSLILLSVCAVASLAQQASGAGGVSAQPSPSPPPDQEGMHALPTYKQLRYEEDWSYLHDETARSDALDRIKYIPLRDKEGWYLSIGGEVRERYERFSNPSWGQEPKDDNGHLLQRYMLHADLRLGARTRFFIQIKSGLENGRNGGPRP